MKDFWGIIIVSLVAVVTVNALYGPKIETPLSFNLSAMIDKLNRGEMVEQVPLTAELELNCRLIHARPEVNTLAIGNSRSETMTAESMGLTVKEALNVSKSSLSFAEMNTLWEAWKSTGRPLKRLILFPDIGFYSGPVEQESRCDLLAAKARGEFTFFKSISDVLNIYVDSAQEILSIDALNVAIAGVQEVVNDPFDDMFPDGSRRFPLRERQRTQDHVDQLAHDEAIYFEKTRFVEPYRTALVKLLRDTKKNKVQETLLITAPYHPLVYEMNKALLGEYENQIAEVARETGVKFYAAADPAKSGCVKSEFMDGHHPKTECMRKVIAKATQESAAPGINEQTEIRAPSGH